MIGVAIDIISDVAAAADPRRADAARRRLEALAAPVMNEFDAYLHREPQPVRRAGADRPALVATSRPASSRESTTNPVATAYSALGGVLLEKAIETMLPRSSGHGAGNFASSMWTSILAQKLADSLSRRVFQLPQPFAATEAAIRSDSPVRPAQPSA